MWSIKPAWNLQLVLNEIMEKKKLPIFKILMLVKNVVHILSYNPVTEKKLFSEVFSIIW